MCHWSRVVQRTPGCGVRGSASTRSNTSAGGRTATNRRPLRSSGTVTAGGLLAPNSTAEQATAKEIEAMGATRRWVSEYPDDPFVVLADPEGNEFCIVRGD